MNKKESSWEKEFPKLYFLFTQPKQSFINFFIKTEKLIRKFIVLSTIILILFLIFDVFKNNYIAMTTGQRVISATYEQAYRLNIYKSYRNAFYTLLFIDLILTTSIIIVRLAKKQKAKALKQFLSWWGTLLFVTFSYAIGGLIVDLIFLAYFIHLGLTGGSIPANF